MAILAARFSVGTTSPNTLAACLGFAFILTLCSLFRTKPWACISLAAPLAFAWALTQSRGAAVGMTLAGLFYVLLFRGRSGCWKTGAFLLFLPLLMLSLAGHQGRLGSGALETAASIRKIFAEAAIMRMAEIWLHDFKPWWPFAEDAALRHGFPVSLEQAKIIKNPLSSLLRLVETKSAWALFSWCLLLGPLFASLIDAVCPRAPRRASAPTAETQDLPFDIIPVLLLYIAVTCVFNDLHQNLYGRVLLAVSLGLGALWFCFKMGARETRSVAYGLSASLASFALLLALGEYRLRAECTTPPIEKWTFSTVGGRGKVAAVNVVEAHAAPTGCVVVFRYDSNNRTEWDYRKAAYHLTRKGWRVVEVDKSDDLAAVAVALGASPRRIMVGLGGPVPAAFSQKHRPELIVLINPSRTTMISAAYERPGAPQKWIFESDEALALAKTISGGPLAAGTDRMDLAVHSDQPVDLLAPFDQGIPDSPATL
jgi:hypothetical protein